MFKTKNLLMVLLIIGLIMPITKIQAAYNSVTWGQDTRLYFSSVAPIEGGVKGISIEVNANTYIDSYIKDVKSLRVTMRPGSEIHLKSMDGKLFQTSIDTAETVCHNGYSTFDYSTPNTTVTFTITLADGSNCQEVEIEDKTIEVPEQINVEGLATITLKGLKSLLNQQTTTHFILNNAVESITVESVGSSQATISLSTPTNKNLYLKLGKTKNIDTDADGYRDLQITLKSTTGGVADLDLKQMPVIKIKTAEPGNLIKVANSSAVYYYGADSRRYVFPNEKVFYSWFDNFDNVVTISDDEMAQLPIGGLVTYRPGVKLVTFTTTKDVYVVTQGGILRKLKDEAMARNLYGEHWNKLVDDINDAFFASYKFGDDLTEVSNYIKDEVMALDPTIGVDKEI